ncbi:MAG: folate-binding protein [Pseudomonadota bacterium]
MKRLVLDNRGLVAISGEDAQSLLQDVISCGVDDLPEGLARPGALLTPQGKIMFDFLLSRDGADRFLFDLGRNQIAGFMQRMTMYRLRAKADIAAVEDSTVQAAWGEQGKDGCLADGRFPLEAYAYRLYGERQAETALIEDYKRLRVEHGVVESEADFELSDVFPHDVLMDLNGGVSFKKGCFVGQEVVSRMQHRGTARRRVVILTAKDPIPSEHRELIAGGRTVGTVGTVAGESALAIARVDRIETAQANQQPLLIGETAVIASLPDWTGLSLSAAEASQKG